MDFFASNEDYGTYALLTIASLAFTMLLGYLCSHCQKNSDPDPLDIMNGRFTQSKSSHKKQ